MFQKQPMMRKVLYALAPIAAFSIWLYGLRALAVLAVGMGTPLLVEFLFERRKGGRTSEAILVTGMLLSLSMPPAVPLWIVAVAGAFGAFMAKEVYGGFGRNVFNPAIAGRLFTYIAFAGALGASFYEAGAFGAAAGTLFGRPDAVSAATPLAAMRAGVRVDPVGLLLGTRPGHAGGALGESSVLLIAAAAVFLVATRTASWRLMVSTLAAGALTVMAFRLLGVPGALPPESLLAGSFVFVAAFMATDPITAPKKKGAQLAYGALIGVSVAVIRGFSAFPEGTSFAVLLGNTFASLFDRIAAGAARRKAEKPKPAAAADAPAPGGAP